MAVMRATSK